MKFCFKIFSRIEDLTEALDEKEKIKQLVKEKEEKLETLNKNFDEKDKLLQELESRCVSRSDEGLTLEMLALKFFTVANLHYQLSW